jgi:hypothetical protein
MPPNGWPPGSTLLLAIVADALAGATFRSPPDADIEP